MTRTIKGKQREFPNVLNLADKILLYLVPLAGAVTAILTALNIIPE